ncbi:WS/DGAT domain-containing protein [Candidatus Mycobacterium wuenschmannii]|uniref:WS/DGAT domain-containing protein n=1 Tax=Candidatus Mycobacterium wuenschmannii TaxID=3027808 RepID=A0ABY8W2B8_9MYCO|nr:WS/DGAT domain-containing protein [Candidatus Mycobacterium wuenschmannii]WIM90005.1 WS/DGAT domain-containing protein [Candidatus Mycobacterium wuenschmannii]
MSNRMTAIDAQFYWMSAKVPTDEIMLYAFDGVPTDFERTVDEILARANDCRALAVRVEDGSPLTYPRWVPTTVERDWIARHDLADTRWQSCIDAVAKLGDDPLDVCTAPWRMHVYTPVHGIPGSTGPGTVAVMQFAHTLSDGPRAIALAAWLFGRPDPVAPVAVERPGFLPLRAIEAARAHRKLVSDTQFGLLPPAIGPRPALSTNAFPTGRRSARTLVRNRTELHGPTATVATLAAVTGALTAHLGDEAEDAVAEVTMAKPGVPRSNNHFANVTVGLYPQLDRADRLQRIAADLTNARRRAEHPAFRAADRAFAATPAPLLRWGISLFDPNDQPSLVAGNTVISSIFRGLADLHFGDAPVLLTAVYPGLSPAMGLVHGVWGIGDTVTVSVHAAESAVGDIDDYVTLLDAEL